MSTVMPQNRLAFPKFKVFVFGVDITSDVLSINVTSHDGNAPNTCQITLQNDLDKYIINTEDVVSLLKQPIDKLDIPWLNGMSSDQSTGATNGILEPGATGFSERLDSGNVSPQKKKILLRKNSIVQGFSPDLRSDIIGRPIVDTGFAQYYSDIIRRYPLADGSPVFHVMDPVRVFMRDPYDPSKWYYHFTGFVSDMIDSADENNTKTFTLVAEDVTKLFRYSRIFINPGILDATKIVQNQDMKIQSFHSNFLHGLNLPEIFFTLIFGPDRIGEDKLPQGAEGPSRQSNKSTRLRGIGHFDFQYSGIFSFGPESEATTTTGESTGPATSLLLLKPEIKIDLPMWQNIIDHEVQPSDLWLMANESLRQNYTADLQKLVDSLPVMSDGKIDVESVINEIGTRPQDYLVDGGKLLMLIPRSLGVTNRDIVMNDIIQNYPLNSEWHAAGHIMHETLERIQFVMYCSPRGDVIIEPPLYDFDPDDFGNDAITQAAFNQKLSSLTSKIDDTYVDGALQGENLAPSRSRGPFSSAYIIKRSDTIRWESAFVDEKVHTVATCAKSLFHNWEGLGTTAIIGDLEVVPIPDLIPLYGVRSVPITPKGYMDTTEAAKLYATITLNKLNADAHTMKIDHMPNIKLGINRPIYIQGRNCIGTTKQVSHSITWGGDMSTTSDIYALRTWSGQMSSTKPNQPLYTPIGGYGSRPLDYGVLFKKKPPPKRQPPTASQVTKNVSDAADKISTTVTKSIKASKNKGVK